ncbi:MAG TPA: response regulator [Gemmataceae bacterium]|nr:response regulator [Gemmataceae bacterium]
MPTDRRLRVLCVDDQPDNADSLTVLLECLGCDARACYDGESALEVVETFHPDICMLDLSMPGMDGVQLAARLRAGTGSHPLILVAATALGAIEERTLTAIAGFHYHLVKPIAFESLGEVIGSLRTLLHLSPASP